MLFPNHMILAGAVYYLRCKLANAFGIIRNLSWRNESLERPSEHRTVSLADTSM